jgi:pimeloyl-ACP methyl ester carboxylesterase
VYWLRLGATAVAAIAITLVVGVFGLLPPRLADTLIHPARVAATRTPANLGLGYEDVTFAGQGVDLSGWYVPGYGDTAVVLVHGFATNRTDQLGLVPALHAAGSHVLLYDQRGVGASGGDSVTFGLYEASDLAAAADYLRARSGARAVGAVGLSLGASVALLAAGRGAPLAAVVADSAFADLEELVSEGTPVRLFVLGSFVGPLWRGMSPLILWHAERQSGLSASAVRPVAHVGKISPRPILLIHGLEDRLLSYENSVALYEAASAPKELWLVPGANHALARRRDPAAYDRRVGEFLAGALHPTADAATPTPAPGGEAERTPVVLPGTPTLSREPDVGSPGA